jgi:hypothetical protein
VPGTFYVNAQLKDLLFEELQQSVQRGEVRHPCCNIEPAQLISN